MPEFYKRVVANQFLLSDEQKAEIEKGLPVTFEGYTVKCTAPGHFHVLIPVGDQLLPLHQGDWMVRHPELELKRDFDFRAQFVATGGNIDPVATEQKLEAFIRERNQKSI